MSNNLHLYDLSFLPSATRVPIGPEIIFRTAPKYFSAIRSQLTEIAKIDKDHAREYCPDEEPEFVLFEPDLFGRIGFGYGACGRITNNGNDLRFCVELGNRQQRRHCVLTIHALLRALSTLSPTHYADRQQQVEIETRADHTASVYGHAMRGWVSPSVTAWISAYAKPTEENAEKKGSARRHPVVSAAMHEAWRATCDTSSCEFIEECYATLHADGRFSLHCFGNACDLSIYPDQYRYGENTEFIDFSCHNLDSARQQLTLLSGLAKLCGLARSA